MSMLNRLARLLTADSRPRRSRPPQHDDDIVRGAEGRPFSREFQTDVVLTAATGCMFLAPWRFPQIVDLLEYVEGQSIVVGSSNADDVLDRLRQSSEHCREWLHQQHPILREFNSVPKDWRGFLQSATRRIGPALTVKPLPIAKVGWLPPNEIFG